MNLILKKCAFALLLGGGFGAAFAVTAVTPNGATVSNNGFQSFNAGVLGDSWVFDHVEIAGTFTDSITFSLQGFSDFSYFANTFFQKGKVDMVAETFAANLDGNVLAITQSGKFASTSGDFQLLAGVHTLTFSGVGTGSAGGKYRLEMSATPVPEPENFAMLLAGLGLVGTVARRRNKVAVR